MSKKAITIEGLLKFEAASERDVTSTMSETDFENFYNANSRALWSYIRRIANSADVADDITQESFIRFLGAAGRKEMNEKAYLYRIATNLV